MNFTLDILKIDPEKEALRICNFLKHEVTAVYKRSGIIVGLSGGVDSAVMAALAVQALGKERVFGLVLPERESNPVSVEYAEKQARSLGIEYEVIDITTTVDSVGGGNGGGYQARDAYIQELIPEYRPEYRYNIILPGNILEKGVYNIYTLQVELPEGPVVKKRLGVDAFRMLAAFASSKIRARMLHLYWEAEKRSLVVAGTTNRTEMVLGDFCKYGDGGTDLEPLSHLYKNQIYQLANHLGIIEEIIDRTPSPDTFSLPVSDQDFFFRIPIEKIDFLLFAWEQSVSAQVVSEVLAINEDAVQRAFTDFSSKHNTTSHLRELPHVVPKNRANNTI